MVGYRVVQIGRALSRLLNALCHGEGDSTFSAWSYEIERRGKGDWRRKFVDALPLNGEGHCYRAWQWHMAHDLIRQDDDAF